MTGSKGPRTGVSDCRIGSWVSRKECPARGRHLRQRVRGGQSRPGPPPAHGRQNRKIAMMQHLLQWQVVQERIAKSKKSSQEPTKVGGKRKASSSAGANGSGRSSKPRLGAMGNIRRAISEGYGREALPHLSSA
jgi:hypothetical protein